MLNIGKIRGVSQERYFFIPASYLGLEGISFRARVLLGLIADISRNKAFRYSNQYISLLLGVDVSHVSRLLKELEGAGHIQVLLRKKKTSMGFKTNRVISFDGVADFNNGVRMWPFIRDKYDLGIKEWVLVSVINSFDGFTYCPERVTEIIDVKKKTAQNLMSILKKKKLITVEDRIARTTFPKVSF